MKRRVARFAFIVTITMIAILTGVAIHAFWLTGFWGGGLGGGFGAVTLMFAGKWFERIWRKPMQGWSE